MATVSERLRALAKAWCLDPDCGDPDCQDCAPYRELLALAEIVEAQARALRQDGNALFVKVEQAMVRLPEDNLVRSANYVAASALTIADALAPEGEP